MKRLILLFCVLSLSLNVYTQSLCQANFMYFIYPPQTIYLSDSSYVSQGGNITNWSWIVTAPNQTILFTSTLQNPTVPINSNIAYVYVCLTISTSLGCTSSYCDTIFLQNTQTCYTNFTYHADSSSIYTYNFYGYSYNAGGIIPAASYSWDFGDGTTSNLQNPAHTFLYPGTYTVCLTTTTNTGCISTYCKNVTIQNPNCVLYVDANITHVSTPGGSDGSIELTVTGGIPPYHFYWYNIGAHTSSVYNLQAGNYTVQISDSDINCPSVTYNYQILEPNNNGNNIVDSLYAVVDTCFNSPIDSFYVDTLYISGNNMVTVVWVLVSGGLNTPIYTTYTYVLYGTQMIVLTINCTGGQKGMMSFVEYIYIDQQSNIIESDNQNSVDLYPNPTHDLLNINIRKLQKPRLISIYNTEGQIVLLQELVQRTNHIALNISSLKKGIYFLKIEFEQGNMEEKKFIK